VDGIRISESDQLLFLVSERGHFLNGEKLFHWVSERFVCGSTQSFASSPSERACVTVTVEIVCVMVGKGIEMMLMLGSE
jgi:hypothetical protein